MSFLRSLLSVKAALRLKKGELWDRWDFFLKKAEINSKYIPYYYGKIYFNLSFSFLSTVGESGKSKNPFLTTSSPFFSCFQIHL